MGSDFSAIVCATFIASATSSVELPNTGDWSSFTTINREGGQLKLLNLSQKIQDLMTITKLHTVFDVYDEETAALNSFK